MGFIIETLLSPHMAGQATRFMARDSRLLDTASRASRSNSKGENQVLFFLEKARTDLSPACSVKVRHLEQARSNLCHLGSACSSHLVRPTHLVNKRGAHEKARPTLCHVGSVKVFSMFLLTLQLTPPALFPACSVKTSHLEQARSDLCPAGSVKVDCVIV